MQLINRTTPDLQHLARHAIATQDIALAQAVSAVIRTRAQAYSTLSRCAYSGWCSQHGQLWLGDMVGICPFCGECTVPF